MKKHTPNKVSSRSTRDIKHEVNNATTNSSAKSRRFSPKKLWWLLVIIPVSLLIAGGSLYAYYISRYSEDVYVDQSYVDSWEQLPSSTITPQPTTAPDAEQPPTPTGTPAEPPSLSDIDGKNDPIIRKDPIDPNIENLLIIGIDGTDAENEGHRSDTMLIVSINKSTKVLKLTSVMRDIWAYFPNRNSWDKINSSYAYGGPGQTVNIINESFSLDIQEYIVLDFTSFQELVDVLGGVSIEVTNEEASKIPDINSGGTYTLNGEQALAYSRLRKIDSDFVRVQRQRKVLLSIFASMRKEDPSTQLSIANSALEYLRSNIPASEITGRLLELALKIDSSVDQLTVPGSGMYKVHDEGIWYMSLNWDTQVDALQEFIYGE